MFVVEKARHLGDQARTDAGVVGLHVIVAAVGRLIETRYGRELRSGVRKMCGGGRGQRFVR